jgi:hypothetical protein
MSQFTVENANNLASALAERGLMSPEEAGAFALALSEIYDETTKLFATLVPALMAGISGDRNLKDLLWDIQESSAHIHHHAKECKLADDLDPWVHLHLKE